MPNEKERTRTAERTLSVERSLNEGTGMVVPYLFVVTDCERPMQPSSRHSLSCVEEVSIGRGAKREAARPEAGRLSLRLDDPRMSSRHARIMRDGERWIVEDQGSKNGTLINGTAKTRAQLSDGDIIEMGYTFLRFRSAQPETVARDVGCSAGEDVSSLVPALAARLDSMKAAAPSVTPVLIRGETGTGKELAAREVHRRSGRTGPFVPVNCGAIAMSVVESELFGARKGAFTGATENRAGIIRAAHGGTLFLDEIGDMPLNAQVALLRVIEEREVLPVGETKAIRVDLRLVTATNRDLDALVSAGGFRSDLLARLRGFEIHLPPLRERREDFGLILSTLCRRIEQDSSFTVTFSVEAMRMLLAYPWPMNIRELKQCLTTAAPLSNGRIVLQQLPDRIRHEPNETLRSPVVTPERDGRPSRAQLVGLLAKYRGNVSAVARKLAKERMQIHRWLKHYDLDLEKFRR